MGILSKLVIATVGTLPHDPARIKQWIEANGGLYSKGVRKGVTHLIASEEAYRTPSASVQQATDLGIWVVSFDWFDDSLQTRRKLGEKKYTWKALRKDSEKRKKLKRLGARADGKKFRDGCQKARELTGSGALKSSTVARKPKKSKSFFFTTPDVPSTPFVPAAEDLKRRRTEREAAVGNEATEGEADNPIEIDDAEPIQSVSSSSMSASSPVAPARSISKRPKSAPLLEKAAVNSTSLSGTQAKIPHIKDIYHYFLDSTGFEYKIILMRSEPSINSFARYHVGLLESHTKPHTYCTIVQYAPPAKKASVVVTHVPGLPPPRNAQANIQRREVKAPIQQQPVFTGTIDGIDAELAAKILTLNDVTQPAYLTPHQTPSPSSNNVIDQQAEATRLANLIAKPSPSPDVPYKDFVCPMNSPFICAWRAFRHTFRDLTLLSWEERFDHNKALQIARAQLLSIEPYLYKKPELGLPMGLLPQETGYLQGNAAGLEVRGDMEDGYVRDAFNLPGISHPLGTQGVVGSALHRREEERKKKVEQERIKAEEKEALERKLRGERKNKRPYYNKPFFNCANGRPSTDDYGRYASSAPVSNGSGVGTRGNGYSGVMWRDSRPFPS